MSTKPGQAHAPLQSEIDEHGTPISDLETSNQISLPTGEALTLQEAAVVTSEVRTQLVVLAGETGSGKTTLGASLYEQFQRGPFGGWMFGGSRSLIGFERRCHFARMASAGPRAETERTRPDEGLHFLHLRLKPMADSATAHDLLLADLAGERYEAARNSADEMRSLTILRRADYLALLVDGSHLTTHSDQERSLTHAHSLLRGALDEGMIGTHAQVDVLLSKWDVVVSSIGGEAAAELVSGPLVSDFARRFGTRLAGLRIHPIAARPSRRSGIEAAFGLAELLSSWLARQRIANDLASAAAIAGMSMREFDRYLLRYGTAVRSDRP